MIFSVTLYGRFCERPLVYRRNFCYSPSILKLCRMCLACHRTGFPGEPMGGPVGASYSILCLDRPIYHQREKRTPDFCRSKYSDLTWTVINRRNFNYAHDAMIRAGTERAAVSPVGREGRYSPTSAPTTSSPSRLSRIVSSSLVVHPPGSAVPVAANRKYQSGVANSLLMRQVYTPFERSLPYNFTSLFVWVLQWTLICRKALTNLARMKGQVRLCRR